MIRLNIKYISLVIIISASLIALYLFSNTIKSPYNNESAISVQINNNLPLTAVTTYGENFAIVPSDYSLNDSLFSDTTTAILVNDTENKIITAYKVHDRIFPASMTKMMTALVISDMINEGQLSLDQIVTISHDINFNDDEVVPSELTTGCQITIKNLLYGLLIESNNYYAIYLAEEAAGSVEAFSEKMNNKAIELGATNTHFVNPNGLHDDNHYTTSYDMYLIMKASIDNELIKLIGSYDSYDYSFINSSGFEVQMSIEPTNLFLTKEVTLPSNVKILTWKTGTTNEAGNCLAMTFSTNNKNYISIITIPTSKLDLYNLFIKLICLAD